MKTPARYLPLCALLVALLTTGVIALAQEAPPPAPAAPEPEKSPAAAEADKAAAPAAPDNTPAPAQAEKTPAPEPAAETPATEAASKPAELRRLDVESAPASSAAPAPAPKPAKENPAKRGHRHNGNPNERVTFRGDSTLAAGEHANAVVSILGSSTSAGEVDDAVVSVLGSSTSSGRVGNAVVSVLGSTTVSGGEVGDAAVSVFGTTTVNAKLGGPAVAVMGDVELGPNAEVREIVCVGGTVKRDPNAVVHGQVTNVGLGLSFGKLEWLHAWVTRCLLFGRPLAFGPHLMWAWWIALGALALYTIIALLFPKNVEKCVQTLEERPGYSLLSAVLVTLLTPLAAIILLVTVVGTPALVIFLLIAGFFGKATMLAWIGRRITRLFGEGSPLNAPAIAVLIGGVIVLLLYTIPVVGFVVAKLISWLGLGVVVYTIILAMKRNKPAAPAPQPVASAAAATTMGAVPMASVEPVTGAEAVPPAAAPMQSAGFGATGETAVPPVSASSGAPVPPVMPVPLPRPAPVAASTLMRAGFWIRLAASVIDTVIVAIAVNLFPDRWEPSFLLTFAVYVCVLWALRGTTVGGIICNLKVVRIDDRPLDWPTALVRTLGGFVSLIAAGLGFIWVAFDDQKQSWHDKIAGTTVVIVPKGVSLI